MPKQGKSLQDLAAELERQTTTRKDYIAPVGAITLEPNEESTDVIVAGLNGAKYALNDLAHAQVADYVGIPKAYYERVRAEKPALLAENVNAWLPEKSADKRLVRTLDGRVRAFLSNRYRPLDNFDLANAVLPTLIEKGVQVVSSELTERRVYIKAILPTLSSTIADGLTFGQGHNAIASQGEVAEFRGGSRRSSTIVAAITISNSEVGAGALRVEPSVFTTWCTNLAVLSEVSMRKYHVGRAFENDEDFSIFTDATRKQDDLAFWLKVRDTVGAAFNEDAFRAAIERIQGAAETPIESDNLVEVVNIATRTLALPDGVRPNILKALAQGGDFSKWGLAQAITNVANRVDDYEFATDLEHAGGKVIDLSDKSWRTIATAA